MKITRKQLRRLINEAVGDMPYRARVMLGLVPGVDVLPTNAIEDPFSLGGDIDDPDHQALYRAMQDLGDAVMSGQQNTSGKIMLKPEKLGDNGERIPYLRNQLNIAKQILMDSDDSRTSRRWFIREEDALIHFVLNLEQVLLRQSSGQI